jgi:hypothetical protein
MTGEWHGCRERFLEENRRRWKIAKGVTGKLPAVEKWTEEETNVLYGKSLAWSAEIAGKASSGDGDERRQKIWREFKDFLAKNAYGVTVDTASSEDVLAFVRGF